MHTPHTPANSENTFIDYTTRAMQLPKHTHIQKTPANSKKHLQTQKTPANSKKHLQTQKTPALSSQHVRCKYSQHKQIGKRTASNDNGNVSGGTIISDGPIAGWRFYSITDVKHTHKTTSLSEHIDKSVIIKEKHVPTHRGGGVTPRSIMSARQGRPNIKTENYITNTVLYSHNSSTS